MCDEWMPVLELPLTLEQYHQLPRNGAYKYEYLGERARLSPRPKHYHALLDLSSFAGEKLECQERVEIRPLVPADWEELEQPFAAAFSHVQPFASLDSATLHKAARTCLQRTRTGKDGPFLPQASFVAGVAGKEGLQGAILITRVPGGDPSDWDSYYWPESKTAGLLEPNAGQPHLTWIFVIPLDFGRGIGSALLSAAVQALREAGHAQLWSTFLSGNDSSMLWHWRNGFRLQPHPGSRRRMERVFRQRTSKT